MSTDLSKLLLLQIIQRQLEQVEEKQRQLEERGVAVEKALRGEAGNSTLFPSWPVLLEHRAVQRQFPMEAQQSLRLRVGY